MIIRLAKLADCDACVKLSQIEELRVADGTYLTKNYFEANIDEDELFFVAENNGTIIGYILGELLKGNGALLNLLAVSQSQRGEGIGKKLVAQFEAQCKIKEIKWILLYATAFNEKTVAFYNKLEYVRGKSHIDFLKML